MSQPFINISCYKFVELDNLEELRSGILGKAKSLELKGTVLLSHEGLNMFVAGTRDAIDQFVEYVQSFEGLDGLPVKESPSDHQPFTRMLVRIKKEIISMGVETIQPERKTSPKIAAPQLKQWLDEGKEITLLDVRNDYEFELGSFENATPIGVDTFREFPEAVDLLPDDSKKRPLVMFCTGGIRCEKAGPLMEEKGFEEVYQLDGGILKYFELCGGEHYQGECFVFDKRVALDPALEETGTTQCYLCQAVVTREQQKSETYIPGECCPNCYQTPEEKMAVRVAKRQVELDEVAKHLPGSQPYDNQRPLNVPLKFDRATAFDFVSQLHSHLPAEYWRTELANGRILYQGKPLGGEQVVRSGWRVEHLLPGTVEPDVNGRIRLIFEDEAVLAVDKPAPLPMHPCGRYNRNTLSYLLGGVYSGQRLRLVHRLDANTSGIVLVCRKRSAADWFRHQFESKLIRKTYLARVHGHVAESEFTCDAPISDGPRQAGQRAIEIDGLDARTDFSLVERFADGTSLVHCQPKTGRTNQIRIHLWHLGHAIVGDPSYLPDGTVTKSQTKTVEDEPMCLHAWKLGFQHVTKEHLELETANPNWALQDSIVD